MKLKDIRRDRSIIPDVKSARSPQCPCGNHLMLRLHAAHENWYCDKCDKTWHSGPGEAAGHPNTLEKLPPCPFCSKSETAKDIGRVRIVSSRDYDGGYKADSGDKATVSCPRCHVYDTKRFYNGGSFQKWMCNREALCGVRWTVTRKGADGIVVKVSEAIDEVTAATLPEPRTTDYCVRCHQSPDGAVHTVHGPAHHTYLDPRIPGNRLAITSGHLRPGGMTLCPYMAEDFCNKCGWLKAVDGICTCDRGGLERAQHFHGCPVIGGDPRTTEIGSGSFTTDSTS